MRRRIIRLLTPNAVGVWSRLAPRRFFPPLSGDERGSLSLVPAVWWLPPAATGVASAASCFSLPARCRRRGKEVPSFVLGSAPQVFAAGKKIFCRSGGLFLHTCFWAQRVFSVNRVICRRALTKKSFLGALVKPSLYIFVLGK